MLRGWLEKTTYDIWIDYRVETTHCLVPNIIKENRHIGPTCWLQLVTFIPEVNLATNRICNDLSNAKQMYIIESRSSLPEVTVGLGLLINLDEYCVNSRITRTCVDPTCVCLTVPTTRKFRSGANITRFVEWTSNGAQRNPRNVCSPRNL